jgi:thiol-disulfide isomerase/thioredoxin
MAFLRARRGSVLWLAAIVLLVVALAALAAVPLLRGDDADTQGTLVGQTAPAISADDLAGRHWTLADGEGRITWINFWATNCEPCRTEMPAMQALAEAYGDRLLVMGVDWGESRESVTDFTDRYAISYPILLDPSLDNFYRWSARAGLPRHYFVDGNGKVVREVIGPLGPARMAQIVEELIGPV